jgi:hypothetical protein
MATAEDTGSGRGRFRSLPHFLTRVERPARHETHETNSKQKIKQLKTEKEDDTMFRTTFKITIAAAILVTATTVASAQAMKAEIPFAFRVGTDMYDAGSYRVEVQNAGTRIWLHPTVKGHGTVVLAMTTQNVPMQWRENGPATLSFECGLGRCQLTQIWSGDEMPVVKLPHPKAGHDEAATLRVIHMARVNSD